MLGSWCFIWGTEGLGRFADITLGSVLLPDVGVF